MTITGIAHAAYNVSDMKASLDFYVAKLGMKHAFSIPRDDGTPWIEYIKLADGQFIELFYSDGGFEGKPAYNHMCIQVPDCIKAAEELEQAGVEIDVMPKQGKDMNWQLWIHDPDGNRIEIMQIDPNAPQARA
ncbi:MAG: VOC family protein [Clostridia bacterium]|nr:VOC family protein [Clostridia bacterium]